MCVLVGPIVGVVTLKDVAVGKVQEGGVAVAAPILGLNNCVVVGHGCLRAEYALAGTLVLYSMEIKVSIRNKLPSNMYLRISNPVQ